MLSLLPWAHSLRPTCLPGLISMLGVEGWAWDPGDNLSPPGGQHWLCRIKAEGPGVPVGLAGTAVNPIGRWHSARLRITCSQRLQISLMFPTGRRLWQPVGAVSPSQPAFSSAALINRSFQMTHARQATAPLSLLCRSLACHFMAHCVTYY